MITDNFGKQNYCFHGNEARLGKKTRERYIFEFFSLIKVAEQILLNCTIHSLFTSLEQEN